ncbi:MAG: nicotinate (nicotinamide) nucleotide adenylyltransferase [Actinomycetes bacterium]
MSRVGIYGGTFDPIHLGHLHVITQLFEKDLVDQLLVIPAGQPLLRTSQPLASPEQRRTMCQLAVSTLPLAFKSKVSVNPIEILRQGPSYAIDTVEAIKAAYPTGDQFFLVVGADAFSKIDQWHRAQELQKMVSIICIDRPGYPSQGIDIAALEVAATTIRQGLSAEVPEIVAAFIRENGLYDNQ